MPGLLDLVDRLDKELIEIRLLTSSDPIDRRMLHQHSSNASNLAQAIRTMLDRDITGEIAKLVRED